MHGHVLLQLFAAPKIHDIENLYAYHENNENFLNYGIGFVPCQL